MKVRALDVNGDWSFGKGQNDYLTKNDAIGQAIQTRLFSFLGDCFFDSGAGVDWFTYLSGKDQLGLKLAIAAVILNTEGVTGLVELSVILGTDRKISIVYNASTVYPGGASGQLNRLLTESGIILDTEQGSQITI